MASSLLRGVVGHVDPRAGNFVFIQHERYPKGVFHYKGQKTRMQVGDLVDFQIDESAGIRNGRHTANFVKVVSGAHGQENGVNDRLVSNGVNDGHVVNDVNRVKLEKRSETECEEGPKSNENGMVEPRRSRNTNKAEWLESRVIGIDSDKIRVKLDTSLEDANVHNLRFNRDLLPQFILEVRLGDALDVFIRRKESNKSNQKSPFISVSSAKIKRYQRRSLSDMNDYIVSLSAKLSSSVEGDAVLFHILQVQPLWQVLLTSDLGEEDVYEIRDYGYNMLKFLHAIITTCGQRHILGLKHVIDRFLSSYQLLQNLQGLLERPGEEEVSMQVVLFELCERISFHYTDCRILLEPLVRHLNSANMFRLLSGVFNFSSGNSSHLTPVLPEKREMLSDGSASKSSQILPFRTSFESSEDYLNHFYNLMRKDAFFLLQSGLKKFRDDTLDPRDLVIFKGLHLKGVQVDDTSLHLLVTFEKCLTRSKLPSDWSKSPILAFGSLVCILLPGNGSGANEEQLLWAIVSDRDEDDLKKRLIGLELLNDFNEINLTQAMLRFADCSSSEVIMAESPTLFPSVGPILQTLKESRLDNFVLRREIVEAKSCGRRPKYIEDLQTDANNKSSDLRDTYRLSGPFGFPHQPKRRCEPIELDKAIDSMKSTLDPAQFVALRKVFSERLSIIQGPPGCGKTFLGVKIVELYLNHGRKSTNCADEESTNRSNDQSDREEEEQNVKEGSSGSVLLLTYKNHALDEFLKHIKDTPVIKEDWEHKLVRIGGRSSEPELECVNLRSILREQREMRHSRRDDEWSFKLQKEYYDAINELSEQRQELNQALDDFVNNTKISPDILYNFLDESQMTDLLFSTPWHLIKIPIKGYLNVSDLRNKFQKIDRETSGAAFALIKNILDSEEVVSKETLDARDFLIDALKRAAEHWWPGRSHFESIKDLTVHVTKEPKYFKETNDKKEKEKSKDEEKKEDEEDEMEEEDVDHLNEILDARFFDEENRGEAKTFKEKSRDQKKHQKAFWLESTNSNGFGLSDTGTMLDQSHFSPSMLIGLSEPLKVKFIMSLIARNRDKHTESIQSLVVKIRVLQERLKSIDVEKRFVCIKDRSVVGVTITGASINRELLRKLNPTLVVVEEAAEILEPSLVAALTSQVQHLVLIGDHKQLKPQVECYELAKNHHFDTSMMERLILANYPYSQLRLQSRMRPEFALLLKDIYPSYESNLKHVSDKKALMCLQKSMFVWNHEFREDAAEKNIQQEQGRGRSKINCREADMVIALALFILANEPDVKPSQITIIAAYLGQSKHIRKRLEGLRNANDSTISTLLRDDEKRERYSGVKVSTIDMYQGDENDYVIVSLVRSNDKGELGFVNTMNRRCVAQSRAKRGMYFVCDTKTLCARSSKVWPPLMRAMIEAGCWGDGIGVRCPRHPDQSRFKVEKAETLLDLVKKKKLLCSQPCSKLFPCSIQSHACRNLCSKCVLTHSTCMAEVDFLHRVCGHPDRRRCYEDESKIICNTIVHFNFKKCGHPGSRKCHKDESMQTCKQPCPVKMDFCNHNCSLKCGQLPHDHSYCRVPVKYRHIRCGHEGASTKECSAPITDQCKKKVNVTLSRCGHIIEKMCYQQESELQCQKPCPKMNDCKLHKCQKACGEMHSHNICSERVDYIFPCGHPSPKKKLCSEKINWPCSHPMYVKKPTCGHIVKKQCFESLDQVVCPHKPCPRRRSDCNHECLLRCGDDCLKTECRVCSLEFKASLDAQKTKAEERIKLLEEKVRKEAHTAFKIEELKNDKDVEYLEIHDKVMLTLKDEHTWYPTITVIKKVINLKLKLNFEKARKDAIDPEGVYLKFHGTSNEGVEGIVKDGFKLPSKAGMFGKGVYLATNSSKSAQDIYTKNSNKLLVCMALLGKSKLVYAANPHLDLNTLRSQGYDSVTAPRRSAAMHSAVMNDEFVVYDPRQAYPVYIVEYHTGHIPTNLMSNLKLPTNSGFQLVELKMKRSFSLNDEEGRLRDTACSILHRFQNLRRCNPTKIEYVANKVLQDRFEAMKKTLRRRGSPDTEILAFHGTNKQNILNIAESNLDMKYCNTFAYGRGFYLSEYPDVSRGYGNGLLLFRVLPGREWVDNTTSDIPPGYDSKKLPGQVAEYGRMNIIPDPDQLLPFFVYHF